MKRTFTATFVVTIDDEEIQVDQYSKPATTNDVKEFLADALEIGLNTEDYGNSVGAISCEVLLDSLKENHD